MLCFALIHLALQGVILHAGYTAWLAVFAAKADPEKSEKDKVSFCHNAAAWDAVESVQCAGICNIVPTCQPQCAWDQEREGGWQAGGKGGRLGPREGGRVSSRGGREGGSGPLLIGRPA